MSCYMNMNMNMNKDSKDNVDTMACCVRAALVRIARMFPDIRVMRKQMRMCAFDSDKFELIVMRDRRFETRRGYLEEVGFMPDPYAYDWVDIGLSLRSLLRAIDSADSELMDTDSYAVWLTPTGPPLTFKDIVEDAEKYGITLMTANWFVDSLPDHVKFDSARMRLLNFLLDDEYSADIVQDVFVERRY